MPDQLNIRHVLLLTVSLVIGAGGFIWLPGVLPTFEATAYAFPLLGVVLALDTLGATAKRPSVWYVIGWLCLVFAAGAALWPLQVLVMDIGSTYQAWREAGWSVARSGWEALAIVRLSEPTQKIANAVAIATGGVAIVFAIGLPLRALFDQRVPRDRRGKDGPWNAGWMAPADIAVLARNKVGLPLARHGRSILRYAAAKGWPGGHHVVISGTRGGKGVSAVIPAILEHSGPVMVLDIKGENHAVTRQYRETLGRKVACLNPFSVIEDRTDRFNPLDYIRPGHLVRDIDVIADGLVKSEAGDGQHFSQMARQLVSAAIEVVITQEEPNKRTLNAVADLLLANGLDATLQAWVDNEDLVGRRPAQVASTVLATGDRERGSIQSTLSKAFYWMRDDAMRHLLSGSTFTLEDLLDDKLDLFIVIPLEQIEAQDVFMRLFTNLALGTVIRQDGRRRVKAPILFVLDEFVRMGRMEKICTIATAAAGVGIEALFVLQEIGQLRAKYGRDDADSILGSCVTKRIFNLRDPATAEWVERHLGEHTVYAQQRRDGKNPIDRPDLSYSEQHQKLMTASQILSMPNDNILVLIGGKPPLKAKLNRYYESSAYKGMWDSNPLA